MSSIGAKIKQSERALEQLERIEQSQDTSDIELPSLYDFVREAWAVIEPGVPFVDGLHIASICLHLEAVTHGKIKRLLVNMPPRFAKSSIISVLWPVWSWLYNPSHKWLCASFALSLAIRDNRKCRLLIQSAWFQQRYGRLFRLADDQKAKILFENTAKGFRQAVSVLSSVTGSGGDTLLIDDCHSIDDKNSELKREGALEWFKDTWSTRLNNPQTGAMVVVGQRVHDHDVSGYITSGETGEEWIHLNLPAEYEPDNCCMTYVDGELFWEDWREEPGELLWPERFPAEVIAKAKRKHGALAFAALYQQRPVPATGGLFNQKWFRYYKDEGGYYELERPGQQVKRVLIEKCQRFITADLAISEKQSADYSVFCMWAVTPDKDLLLIDRVRDHFDFPEQQKQISKMYQRYVPAMVIIESVAYQLALIQTLRKQGLPVKEYKPVKDKVTRATTAAVLYEGGQVYHPKKVSWLQELEDELLVFPRGAHDDIVDNVSMACDSIATKLKSPEEHLDFMREQVARMKAQPARPLPQTPRY